VQSCFQSWIARPVSDENGGRVIAVGGTTPRRPQDAGASATRKAAMTNCSVSLLMARGRNAATVTAAGSRG